MRKIRNLRHETETIQVSIYCEIIKQILKEHKELSVSKMLVFAYLIKKEQFSLSSVYASNTSRDLIYKGLSLLTGDYEGFCNSIEYIIKAIHLLIKKNIIDIEDNIIMEISHSEIGQIIYKESLFLKKVIEASKKMTDRQFMKEVMYNV